MALERGRSISDISFSDRLTKRLGGLVLKEKQEEALKNLLDGKDVFAVLPTGFGKSLIYQSFVIAKEMEECVTDPCCLVIVPLRSIVEEQFWHDSQGFREIQRSLEGH